MTSPRSDSPSASKAKWNREATFKLISSYQAHSQLWDTGCDDYKYPTKKKEALQEMAQEFQCPMEEIEKKITSIRAQFFRELGLVEAKKETSSGDPYSPKWYAYKKLQFLAGKCMARGNRQPKDPAKALHFTKKKRTLKLKNVGYIQERCSLMSTPMAKAAETNDISHEKKHDDEVQEGIFSEGTPKTNSLLASGTDDKIEIKDSQHHQDCNDEPLTHNSNMGRAQKPLKCSPSSTCTLEIGGHLSANTNQTREERRTGVPDSTFPIQHHSDEFSIFGEYVATTLRKLSGQYLQCYAKHEINDILFHVEAQNCQPNAVSNVNTNRHTINFRNIPQQSLHYYDLTAPKSNTNQ